MTALCIVASIVLALTACTGDASPIMEPDVTYITGATALVGADLDPVEDAVIELRGATIAAVGPRSEIAPRDKTRVIDATGTTLVPGFIDAHVHIGFYDPSEVLRGGVTTVRDLGWPPQIIFPLARRSKSPEFPGPRILAAGPMLTVDGGYPTRSSWAPDGTGLVISHAAEVPRTIADLKSQDASIVKVALNPVAGPVLDASTLKTIVKEAHDAGLKVTGHVTGLAELEKAIDAGMDELAHMLMSPEAIPRHLVEQMVAGDMAVVPTLAIRSGRDRRMAVANLRAFRASGGKVLYGTDLGNSGVSPGMDPNEVRLMSKAGMSPLDIVRSATVDSASRLGLHDRGVIAPGRQADLVALAGQLDRATDLTRVEMVWRAGARID
jgi:imidazolonepropionase-like amidohydrolase